MISKENSTLFSYVIFIHLSTKSIWEFNKSLDINDMNNSLWKSICYRLEQDISSNSLEAYLRSHQEFHSNRYVPKILEHIIKHLGEQWYRNDYSKLHHFFIEKPWKSKNWIDFWAKWWSFLGKKWSWFLDWIWLQKRKFLLDHSSLKTYNTGVNSDHLWSWILKVSNDGKRFQEI